MTTRTMISKRVQGFSESVIREMTRVSHEYGGINLAQGMPSFPPPRELVEAAHRGPRRRLPPVRSTTWGAPGFRPALADKYRRFYGMDARPEPAGK